MIRNGKECKRKLWSEVQSRDLSSNTDISAEKPLPIRHSSNWTEQQSECPAHTTAQALSRDGACRGSGSGLVLPHLPTAESCSQKPRAQSSQL